MTEIQNQIRERIIFRAEQRLKSVSYLTKSMKLKEFYLAGSSLTEICNDVDLFPISEFPVSTIPSKFGNFLISKTPNATTFRLPNNVVVQLCNHHKPTLESLVNSFDFTHIQVGAKCTPDTVNRVYFTDGFISANALGDTEYTGSDYPFASMIRLFKYHKRNQISRFNLIRSVVDIMIDIQNRGFADWEDYQKQINGIDPGLITSFEEFQNTRFFQFFDLLRRDI